MEEPLRFDGTQHDQYGCPIWDKIPVWKLAERIVKDAAFTLEQDWKKFLEND